MKKTISFILIIFSVFLFSCNDNSGGSTVIAPGDSDAYIIDGVLCANISNNFPSAITDYFYQGDRVNLWIQWANITKGQRVTVEWWNPNNTKDRENTSEFISTATKQISIHYLDLSSFATTGEWLAKVYLDNKFMRSYLFMVSTK